MTMFYGRSGAAPSTGNFQFRKPGAWKERGDNLTPGLQAAFGAAQTPFPHLPQHGGLRLVHVGPVFGRGGAEQSFIDLARFLDPQRVSVAKSIVACPDTIDPMVAAESPFPVVAGGVDEVRQAAREADIILYWGMSLDQWLGDCRPKLCIFLAHGESLWTRRQLEGSRRVTDHTIAVSQRVADRVCYGAPATVIHNGIDAARLAQSRSRADVRQSLGFEPDDYVLGFVGRLSREKRPELLVEAIAQLPPRFKALILGQGQMQSDLLELANERIPGRYVIRHSHHHLGNYYQAMDAFCLLSSQEGFALVLLEAMYCGLPVITTNVGIAPEIVHDRVTGVFVDGAADDIARAARLLSDRPHWARGMALQGQEYAENHGHATQMADRYESLLEQLWREKHGGRSPQPSSGL